MEQNLINNLLEENNILECYNLDYDLILDWEDNYPLLVLWYILEEDSPTVKLIYKHIDNKWTLVGREVDYTISLYKEVKKQNDSRGRIHSEKKD